MQRKNCQMNTFTYTKLLRCWNEKKFTSKYVEFEFQIEADRTKLVYPARVRLQHCTVMNRYRIDQVSVLPWRVDGHTYCQIFALHWFLFIINNHTKTTMAADVIVYCACISGSHDRMKEEQRRTNKLHLAI